jgi:putative two-component system response regulator
MLRQILAELADNYDVALAKSGAMALKVCAAEKPDLILLDVEMPEMNGFEVLARIKLNPYLSNVPVIFLTGNIDVETEVRALKSGAADFITKPVEKAILQHRIRLHLERARKQAQLENKVSALSESVALSFAEMIEYRDENTGGHVQRTANYVRMLGQALIEMGAFPGELTGSDLDLMVRAAPLHDIGKVAIPDRILLKPDQLNDEEFAIMKSHSAIGAEILENMYKRTPTLHYLQYARLIALSHHERYDGKGYPQHLKGTEIPLCARIMAVADVYDALAESRVYRKGMELAQVYKIITSGAGTQFDPQVVEAFKQIFPELEQKHG